MDDLIGADLQSAQEETGALGSIVAPEGYSADRSGNLYENPKEAAPAAPAAAAAPAAPDPAILAQVQGLQQRAERAEQYMAQQQQYQAQQDYARWEAQVKALPPQQQQIAIAQRQVELANQRVQAAHQAQQAQARAAEPVMKQLVITEMAKQHGVDPALLAGFSDPTAMEEFAKAWSAHTRTGALQTRQQSGVDSAARGNSGRTAGVPSWRQESLSAQLARVFD